jgi:hypothetical protein
MNYIKGKQNSIQIIPQKLIPQKIIPQKIIPQKLTICSIGFAHIIISTILIFYIILPLIKLLDIKDSRLDLFVNYYSTDKFKILIINFFINYLYLKIAEIVPSQIPLFYKRILVIIIFNILLSYYINNTSYESSTIKFLKIWFKSVGFFVILWDLIYISSIGLLADKLNQIELYKNNFVQLISFAIFSFTLIHL